ncbi:MAG: hypothetical protein ACI90V_013036, partial [Bacillariaceae sp.]
FLDLAETDGGKQNFLISSFFFFCSLILSFFDHQQ